MILTTVLILMSPIKTQYIDLRFTKDLMCKDYKHITNEKVLIKNIENYESHFEVPVEGDSWILATICTKNLTKFPHP